MIGRRTFLIGIAIALLAGSLEAGSVPSFRRQVLDGPEGRSFWNGNINLIDVDGDRLVEIIRGSSSGYIYLYHQTENGFPGRPTQKWKLPANTDWIACTDVEGDGKKEILTASGEGIAYFHLNGHVFNPNPVWLVHEKMIFSESSLLPVPFSCKAEENDLPVPLKKIAAIFRDHAIFYENNGHGDFKPGKKSPFIQERTMKENLPVFWKEYARWGLGNSDSKYLTVQTKAFIKKNPTEKKELSDEGIEKLQESFKNNKQIRTCEIERADINGDGRPDAVLWYMSQDMDPRITWLIFLRKPDGRLPEKPDQILRTRGWPLWYIGSKSLVDIDGHGKIVLIMREMKTNALSAKSFLEMVMSNGIEWTIAIRKFNPGKGFSSRPDFTLNITANFLGWKSINLEGDFNGDGRPDLMVQRSSTRYDVVLSNRSDEWFERAPRISFDVPMEFTWMDIADYNHDKVSDFSLIDDLTGQLVIFLSQPCKKETAE